MTKGEESPPNSTKGPIKYTNQGKPYVEVSADELMREVMGKTFE